MLADTIVAPESHSSGLGLAMIISLYTFPNVLECKARPAGKVAVWQLTGQLHIPPQLRSDHIKCAQGARASHQLAARLSPACELEIR